MSPLTPYLFFRGNCRKAMEFYQECFGGELQIMTYGESPEPFHKQADKNHIMHASLQKGDMRIMASDSPTEEFTEGNSIHLSIDCASKEQTETLFNKLKQDGKITQPLTDTFWGAYFGMVIDQFGIHWMLNCQLQPK